MKEFNSSEENYAGRSNEHRVTANQSRGSGRLTGQRSIATVMHVDCILSYKVRQLSAWTFIFIAIITGQTNFEGILIISLDCQPRESIQLLNTKIDLRY